MTTEPRTEAGLREALTEAGFLDAYLNIRGMGDEEEAWRTLLDDVMRLRDAGWKVAPIIPDWPDQAAEAVVSMATGIGMDGRLRGLLAAALAHPAQAEEKR